MLFAGTCIDKTHDSLQISIYAVPEKIDQTAFALDAAVKLLDFYEDYFDIPYPLPKQGSLTNVSLQFYKQVDRAHSLSFPPLCLQALYQFDESEINPKDLGNIPSSLPEYSSTHSVHY